MIPLAHLGYPALAVLTGLALWPAWSGRPAAWWNGRPAFAVLLAVTLLLAHAPALGHPRELPNPDEAQLIAGALTLRHEFAPWRSVDLSTSGPVSVFPLLVGPADFQQARWLAALAVATTLVLGWLALTTRRDDGFARIGALPVVAFFVFMQDIELFQFSSEHVAITLLAGAAGVWLAATAHGEKLPSRPAAFGLGVCLGGAVMAKLQSVPCVAWLGLFTGTLMLLDGRVRRARRLAVCGALLAGGLLVPAGFALLAAGQGVLADFIHSYALNNVHYVSGMEHYSHSYEPASVWGLNYLLKPAALLLLAGLLASRRFAPADRWTALLALGWLAAAIVAIMLPGRNSRHYWFFVFGPVLFALGAVISPAWRASLTRWPALAARQRWAQLALVAFLLGLPVAHRLASSRDLALAGSLAEPQTVQGAGEKIRGLARPGDALTIWGWRPELHVFSGLPQGTRDAHSQWQIAAIPQRDYYRRRFLADLDRTKPRFFVDAVGPGGFGFTDRAAAGHETFPPLAELIRTHYTFLGETEAMRLYVRHAD